jgi:hypothetical protein
MRHSEKIDQIAAALCLAQGNLGDIIKSSVNPHFNSKYAALPDVVEAIVPVLQASGIAVLQSGSTTVETMLIHAASGQWIAGDFVLPAPNDVQKAAGANTYGRRYALLGMVCAAAEDDDGNQAAGHQPARKLTAVARTGKAQPQVVSAPLGQAQPQGVSAGSALVFRAYDLGLIPEPDREMFFDWAKASVTGCSDIDGNLKRRHMQAIENALMFEAQAAR